MDEVFFALCKQVDTPVSLSAWLRYKYSHSELADMAVRPRDYVHAATFASDYAVVSYLSKYKGLNTGADLKAVAIQKFTSSELVCKETNKRLRNATQLTPELASVIHRAQRKIAKLLGPFSLFCIRDTYGWGPGASTDLRRKEAFLDTKMCQIPLPVSRSCRAMLRNEIESDRHWSEAILGHEVLGAYCLLDDVFVLNDNCRVETVPKNAKTDRVIAIENRGNSFIQKGFGGYFRERLRRVGVDLNNQAVNQELARRAVSEGLATLDLRAASDTVALEAVWLLLPYEWAASLDAARSRYAEMPDGSIVKLNKFSSMGNGFTFELESLIFWAISSAVSEDSKGIVAVYGDDIIVTQSNASAVVAALEYMGFEVNGDKSFTDGLFFESCGKHYFDGLDVTPAYQKEVPDCALSWAALGNRLIRLAYRFGMGYSLDSRVRGAWNAAFREGSSYLVRVGRQTYPGTHFRIPFSPEGDDGWAVPVSFEFPNLCPVGARKRTGWKEDFGYPAYQVMRRRTKSFVANDFALYAWSLRRGVETETPFNGFLSSSDEDSQILVNYREICRGLPVDWD